MLNSRRQCNQVHNTKTILSTLNAITVSYTNTSRNQNVDFWVCEHVLCEMKERTNKYIFNLIFLERI